MARRLTAISDKPSREDAFVIKKYNEVVQSTELVDIRLTTSRFKVSPEYFTQENRNDDSKKEGTPYVLKGRVKYSEYNAEDGYIIGDFDWSASYKRGRRTLLSIDASYLIVYKASKALEERYALRFLKNVGRFATFPYFRALAAQYSAASSADFPILPVLKQRIDISANEEGPRSHSKTETSAVPADSG